MIIPQFQFLQVRVVQGKKMNKYVFIFLVLFNQSYSFHQSENSIDMFGENRDIAELVASHTLKRVKSSRRRPVVIYEVSSPDGKKINNVRIEYVLDIR